MEPGAATAWSDFFVAQASAAAALAGLLFVAVSLNLELILRYPDLPTRAGRALLLLLQLLLVAILGLVPGQDNIALGVELVLLGGVFTVVVLLLGARGLEVATRTDPGDDANRRVMTIVLEVAALVPTIAAGLSLLAGGGGGLAWVAVGAVLLFSLALAEAWVLLVEIHR